MTLTSVKPISSDINTPPVIIQPTEVLPEYDEVFPVEHTDEGPNVVGTVTSIFTALGSDADGDDITWEMEFVNGKGEQLYDFDPDSELGHRTMYYLDNSNLLAN